MVDSLVSIITPVYNCENYIENTIKCVQAQTYKNWEMILVDDCSPDKSAEIILKMAEQDNRIKYIKHTENSGAAVARNTALDASNGRYIAYLDADDLWKPQKLERQIDFMNKNNVAFSCCDYEKIEHDGTPLNKIVHMPKSMTYNQFLSNTIIQTVGVIVDLQKAEKKLLVMPNVRRGQNEVLAYYRRVPQSLSSNKLQAMKRTWHLYRKIEHLSLPKSVYCLVGWAYHASIKRIYLKKHKGEKK